MLASCMPFTKSRITEINDSECFYICAFYNRRTTCKIAIVVSWVSYQNTDMRLKLQRLLWHVPFVKIQTCDAIFVIRVSYRKKGIWCRWYNCCVHVHPLSKGGRDVARTVMKSALLVTGYPEDDEGVAQRDPSTGRRRINFRGVHTMGTLCWTALIWLLMAVAIVAATG
jgi:hypothetical protein